MLVTCFSTARSVTKSRSAIAWLSVLGHQLEHLALARGQLLEGVVGALAPDELTDDGGVERGAAVGDAADGRPELFEVCDAVFEEVADALRARLEQGHGVARLDVLRGRRTPTSGCRSRISRCAEPFIGVRRRHPDVDDGDVGLVHRDVAEQVLGRPGLRDHLEARLLQQAGNALAKQNRVVRENDPPRVAELGDRTAEGREVAREAVDEHLVDALGVGKALQPVRPEILVSTPLTNGAAVDDSSIWPPWPEAAIREARITSSPVYPSSPRWGPRCGGPSAP